MKNAAVKETSLSLNHVEYHLKSQDILLLSAKPNLLTTLTAYNAPEPAGQDI